MKCRHFMAWALTPRFHPRPPMAGSYFLWHLLYPSADGPFPLGSTAPCVVPTFLLHLLTEATDRAADTIAKLRNITFIKI